jgi:hypothetical protein
VGAVRAVEGPTAAAAMVSKTATRSVRPPAVRRGKRGAVHPAHPLAVGEQHGGVGHIRRKRVEQLADARRGEE